MICAHKTEESNVEGYLAVQVPSSTWAIFRSRNHTQEETTGVLQSLIKQVYTEWLLTASYNKLDGYEIEIYFGAEDGMCYCETWIRVEPK